MARVFLLVHLVAFAAYLGAGFAQTQLMKRSGAVGMAGAMREELERLVAGIVTKIELPAILVLLVSGVYNLVALQPELMRKGWMHGKLACVALLLVLSHLEMFNARAIVKLRAAGGEGAEVAIAGRKRRHAIYGAFGALLVVAVVLLVTMVR